MIQTYLHTNQNQPQKFQANTHVTKLKTKPFIKIMTNW